MPQMTSSDNTLNRDLIAVKLSPSDGGGHFFEDAPPSVFCPNCDSWIDRDFTPKNLKYGRRGYDLSATYDGQTIVSQKFKDFYHRYGYQGDEFRLVNNTRKLYFFLPVRILEFDPDPAGTRFLKYCETCGQYESVVGTVPAVLKGVTSPLPSGFYRSDIEFASGQAKHPLIFAGLETWEQIKTEKLKGMYPYPVYASGYA